MGSERMTQLPLKSIFSGSASLGKSPTMTVSGITKQASFFERVGSPRARRHFAGLLKSIQRAGILVAAVSRGFMLHDVRPWLGGISRPNRGRRASSGPC
jgi:hypothetical protein